MAAALALSAGATTVPVMADDVTELYHLEPHRYRSDRSMVGRKACRME